jgi:hypothetical protein
VAVSATSVPVVYVGRGRRGVRKKHEQLYREDNPNREENQLPASCCPFARPQPSRELPRPPRKKGEYRPAKQERTSRDFGVALFLLDSQAEEMAQDILVYKLLLVIKEDNFLNPRSKTVEQSPLPFACRQ